MAEQLSTAIRGILNPHVGEQKFALARYAPSAALASYVEHYWTVKWDLRGQTPYQSETLPHPSVHLTVEPDRAHVVGVVTRKFGRHLAGAGWVFGIKFRPGGFYPFVQQPIASFTDRTLELSALFGAQGSHYAAAQRSATTDTARIHIAEEFLTALAPVADEQGAEVAAIIATIRNDRTITKVDDVVARCGYNKRALQRLFQARVGVSPKWVIQRYRLHEAIAQAAAGKGVDWAALAAELGYFDQAHLIKDFKALVGMTPADYARQSAAGAPHCHDGQSVV